MSVVVTVRVKADPAKLDEFAKKEPGTLAAISGKGKAGGAIHHEFYSGDGEVVVIDEWKDEASFRSFFEGTPDIERVMAAAGATSAPEITILRRMDLGDSF
ncbi:MAG: putative quinol monooxygenase [Candidatus Nanopelagicales bacterium]